MCNNWTLSVEMNIKGYIKTNESPESAGIIRVGVKGLSRSTYGSTIVHVGLRNSTDKLWIVSQHSRNTNKKHKCQFPRPKSSFVLKMSESNGRLKTDINNLTVFNEPQDTPTNVDNVTAEIGNLSRAKPSGWYKNFHVWTHC